MASAYLIVALTILGTTPVRTAAEPLSASLRVSAVQANQVTFTWKGSPVAEPPDYYLLEGGFAPGEVLASLPLDRASSTVSLRLNPGVYFARLHEVRSGGRGPASNEVQFTVGLRLPPAMPAEFRALAMGSDVSLSWRASFAGGSPTQAILDVTGPLALSIPLPSSGDIVFGGVPDGVYSVSLRAVNDAGSSPSTAPIAIVMPWDPGQLLLTAEQAPDASGLPVRYEDFSDPRLATLRDRERLDSVVAGAATELETITRLRDWVAAQWGMGDPVPYPPWDAMTILDWIRAGTTSGFCAQYSQVFLQSLAALGIPARYLEIGTAGNAFNHFTTEVWSNQFRKWMLIDVAFNNHFERNGVPLSALEIRDAYLQGQMADVDVILGPTRAGHPSPLDWPYGTAELFYYVRYHLNANHVSAPGEAPFDRFNDMVEWLDGQTVPWELSTVPSDFPHELPTAMATGDREFAEWRPNLVWITASRSGVMEMTLHLQHSVLRFDHFEFRVIGAEGASSWQAIGSPSIRWQVKPGDTSLEVRGVNVKGVAGPVSSVQLLMP